MNEISYEEQLRMLALEMARTKYLERSFKKESVKERLINEFLPAARIAIKFGAECYSGGYTKMNLHSRLGKSMTQKWQDSLQEDLESYGLVPPESTIKQK